MSAHDFINDLEFTVAKVTEFPDAWPGLSSPGLRRCIFSKFRNQLIYRVEGDVIRVFAVAHLARRPGYWRRRLTP